MAIRSRVKSIVKRHERKFIKFRQQHQTQLDTIHMKVNPYLSGLFWGLFCGGGGVKLPPVENSIELCQKLQICDLSTHTYAVSEKIFFSTKAHLILLISAFS